MLFSRMANSIALAHPEIEIFIIDYVDGAMTTNISGLPNIHLLPFSDGKSIAVPDDSILIMQSILPYSMRPELVIPPKTKLLFWTLHPDNFIPVLIPPHKFRNLQYKYFWFYRLISSFFYSRTIENLRSFILLCLGKKALYFMDQTNLDKTNRYLGLNIQNVDFLPVPASDVPICNAKKRVDPEEKHISFCWIGRLCDWKAHMLIYTIRKLATVAKELKINIVYHVIGDGEFREAVENIGVDNDYFRLKMLGSLMPSVLDEFLLGKVDILTAMGTSALEGAKYGIPTILIDFSYYPVKKDYKYRWLHNTVNFDLAHEIADSDFETGNSTLKDMLIAAGNDYDQLSKRSKEYFDNKHAIGGVMDKFIKNAYSSELSFEQINPDVLKKGFLRRISDRLKYKWIHKSAVTGK